MRLSYTVICCAIFLLYSGRIPSVTVITVLLQVKGATSVSIKYIAMFIPCKVIMLQ